MRRILFFTFMSFWSTITYSYDFSVNGIYYSILSFEEQTVAVVSGNESHNEIIRINGNPYLRQVASVNNSYGGNIIIPSEVTYNGKKMRVISIAASAFFQSDVEKIQLPFGIKKIGQKAFENCLKLKEIVLSNTIVEIENRAFYHCPELTSVIFPKSVEIIGEEAFSNCWKLRYVKFSEGIKSIGKSAFSSCDELRLSEERLPSTVEYIYQWAFRNCRNLEHIQLSNNVKYIEDVFPNLNLLYLEDGDVPILTKGSLMYIHGQQYQAGVFSSTKIDSLYLGRNLVYKTGYKNDTIFESPFFLNESISYVNIGKYVTQIPPLYYSSLKVILCQHYTPIEIEEKTFSNSTYAGAVLYVPTGSKYLYESAPNWRKFFNIQEKDVSEMQEDIGRGNINIPDDDQLYITLQLADKGVLMQQVTSGYSYKYKISPSKGWQINTVTFNGTDVSDCLDENMVFTTPIITSNSVLSVSFRENDNTAVNNQHKSNMKVYAQNNILCIKNILVNDVIRIYDVEGNLYHTISTTEGEFNINLPTGNTYVVKGKYDTIKIRL